MGGCLETRGRARVSYALAASIVVFTSGCWDTPLDGTFLANVTDEVHFHGYIPVPQGEPIPNVPVDVYANSDLIERIWLQPSMFERTLGRYDWYEVSFDRLIPEPLWRKEKLDGRRVYRATIGSNFQVPWIPLSLLPFFANGEAMNCFYRNIAAGKTIAETYADCPGIRSPATIYAPR